MAGTSGDIIMDDLIVYLIRDGNLPDLAFGIKDFSYDGFVC